MKIKTPFPTVGYFGPDYFCDREVELETLLQQVAGGIPTVVIGIRRLGKTGLIKHLFHHLKSTGVFVDLQGTNTISELVSRLATGMAEAFPEKKSKNIWDGIKSFRPMMTFDPLNGLPEFSFDFKQLSEAKQTLHGILKLLSDKDVVISLDEFQEIGNYEEENIEGLLRAVMQQFPSVKFIFSGSRTRMLLSMFQDGSKPFFSNVGKLYLDKIEMSIYRDFILNQFRLSRKTISNAIVEEILEWTEVHTFYTQFVCNQLFLNTNKKVELNDLKERILGTSKQDFFQLKNLMTTNQWRLIVAIAKEKELYKPYGKGHQINYKLSTPAGTKKTLLSLLEKQLVNENYNEIGEPFYKLADVFLMRFIRHNF